MTLSLAVSTVALAEVFDGYDPALPFIEGDGQAGTHALEGGVDLSLYSHDSHGVLVITADGARDALEGMRLADADEILRDMIRWVHEEEPERLDALEAALEAHGLHAHSRANLIESYRPDDYPDVREPAVAQPTPAAELPDDLRAIVQAEVRRTVAALLRKRT